MERSEPHDDDVRETLWPCGVLGRPHGLAGEIALTPGPDGVARLARGALFWVERVSGAVPEAVSIERVGGTDRRPCLRVEGVETREQAARLTGCLLLASGGGLDEIPRYRVGDLIGLSAVSGDVRLGVVADVLEGARHEILRIVPEEGDEVLVPLVEDVVDVDCEGGVVNVREGLLE